MKDFPHRVTDDPGSAKDVSALFCFCLFVCMFFCPRGVSGQLGNRAVRPGVAGAAVATPFSPFFKVLPALGQIMQRRRKANT